MKNLLAILVLFSAVTIAEEELQNADPAFVKETYEYCLDMQPDENIDKKLLLECVNSELDWYAYNGFAELGKVIEVAESVPDEPL